MATASRALGPQKWTGILRRLRRSLSHRGRLPASRDRLAFRVRAARLPRIAWGRPAVKWGLGRPGLWLPLWRPATFRAAGWRAGLRIPAARPRGLPGRAGARRLAGRGLGRRLRAAALAVMVLAFLALPLMAGRAAREHLALYWEGIVAPLARWVRLDEATAFWLVAGAVPGATALPAGAHPPVAGLQAGSASGYGGIWSEVRAWAAWLAERLPRWMVVREFPILGTAAISPLSATVGPPSQGPGLPPGPPQADQGPVSGENPAGLIAPTPAEPAGAAAGARPLTDGPDAPRILIYHSHTSEMYREEGEPLREASTYHRFNTVETGVVRTGRTLARALEARGIPVLHDTAIYDYPSHPRAYLESGRAVAGLLARYPSIQVVIDLHRDTPADMVATVNGRRVARITLVVATAVDSGLPHAGWRENLAFAQELARVMNERTPGLLDRILQVPNRRYNQELHPHALLVEVGSYHNTQAEADAAAELLAESLAQVILELPARAGTPGPARP